MSDDVNIRISATDNATATLRAIQGELGKFSASIKGIASLTIAGLGVRELSSFAGDSIKAYAESERAVTMLDRVLKSTGNTIKLTRQQIQEYADARMAQTAFDDDAIVEAASQLARFRDISGDTFTATLDAAQDLATVMGTDLVSATQMLGRAMSDPAEGLAKLARAGVMFTDQQKEQIKVLDLLGNKAAQQKIILQELQRQFGGAAVEDATTASGQIKQMTNAIGELKEAIGKTLAGAILPLISQITGKPTSLDTSAGALAASQVGTQERKNIELAAVNQQIAILEQERRKISQELRDNQGTILGSLGGFAGFTVPREDRVKEIQARVRELMQQAEAIAAQAAIDQAQSAGGMGAIGAAANLIGGLGNGFGGMLNGAQGNFLGMQIQNPGLGEVLGGIGQQLGQSMFGDLMNQFQFGGMMEDNQEKRRQEVERSLQATESRFLTRGRGSLSPEAKKAAEDNAKQLAELKSIRDAIANLGGNVLVVEGVA